MNTTLTLMDLAGAIALLIWGVHMVQAGITRVFGPHLRRILGYAIGSRCQAFLAGLGVNGGTPEQHGNLADDDGLPPAASSTSCPRWRSCWAPMSAPR